MTPVTDHAIVRWLERVRRLDFSHLPSDWSDARRAAWGCDQLGMTPAEAMAEVLPPRLAGYLALDPRAIRAHDRVLVVEGRRVVTVLPPGSRTGTRARGVMGNPRNDHSGGHISAFAEMT